MADLNKIIDELSKLTVVEAAELSKQLEEKWGVTAAAAVAVVQILFSAISSDVINTIWNHWGCSWSHFDGNEFISLINDGYSSIDWCCC